MAHINSGVIAISQTLNPTRFQKTLGVNDYYWGADDSELPLGHIQMLGKLGMHEHHLIRRWAYLENKIPVAGVAHQAGTCRFGSDPATSVLDTNCRAHELDNLYVVDTSFFPSISAVNPALTAMANALRVGDHLLARLA